MKEQFEIVIDNRTYLLKRLFHEDLPVTYHIHLGTGSKTLIFRMRQENNEWKLLPHDFLPDFVFDSEKLIARAVSRNEAGLRIRSKPSP
jgi:hypothetical protein